MAVLTTIGFSNVSLKILFYKAELIIMPIGTYDNLTAKHMFTLNFTLFSQFFLILKNEAMSAER